MKTPEARYTEPPRHVRALDRRIANVARSLSVDELRLRRTLANTVLAQMLPECIVRGGNAIKFRLGEASTRFTTDLDVLRRKEFAHDRYLSSLNTFLTEGWGGFSGRVVHLPQAEPVGVPIDYVMQPLDIKMLYRSQSWITTRLEIGVDEIAGVESRSFQMSDEVADLVERLGFPTPSAVPVLELEHQFAQKLHACTAIDAHGRNSRAHDLVDLQVLSRVRPIDREVLAQVGRRLFAARQGPRWPPRVQRSEGWDELYESAAYGLDVLPLDAALLWINTLIEDLAQPDF